MVAHAHAEQPAGTAASADGFLGCDESFNYTLPPELRTADYGEPLAPCKELSDGVFERRFTRSVARLDCNSWTGSITHRNG